MCQSLLKSETIYPHSWIPETLSISLDSMERAATLQASIALKTHNSVARSAGVVVIESKQAATHRETVFLVVES